MTKFTEPIEARTADLAESIHLLKKLSLRLPIITITLAGLGAAAIRHFWGSEEGSLLGFILYVEFVCSPFYLFIAAGYFYLKFFHKPVVRELELRDNGIWQGKRLPVVRFKHLVSYEFSKIEDYYSVVFVTRRPLEFKKRQRIYVPQRIFERSVRAEIEGAISSKA